MYATHLLDKLLDWLSENNIIGPGLEKTWFRAGKSTLKNRLILANLASKVYCKAKLTLCRFPGPQGSI